MNKRSINKIVAKVKQDRINTEQKDQGFKVDKKHRFPLRISSSLHNKASNFCHAHDLSQNLYYAEAIKFSMNNHEFEVYMKDKYVRNQDKGIFMV